MRLNKHEWNVIVKTYDTLNNLRICMTSEQLQTVDELSKIISESARQQIETREKTYARIKEKRLTDKNYGRSKKQFYKGKWQWHKKLT